MKEIYAPVFRKSLLMILNFYMVLYAAGDNSQENIKLADNSKTEYVIIVSANDIVANTAAKELVEHLEAMTGAKFKIVKPGEAGEHPVIAIGPEAAKSIMHNINLNFSDLGDDGILLKREGKNIILSGAEKTRRGTLYAVYDFLENTLGCRWWTPSAVYIPQKSYLEINNIDKLYVPPIRYRECNTLTRIFAARCRNNGHWSKILPEYGGNYSILGWCHTFYKLLPPEKYFKDHPEWYSERDGKRVSGGGCQLCLTNDAMRNELTKNALAQIRKNPQAGFISISQNDTITPTLCECEKCRPLMETEGAPSGVLIDFINKVAEDIEKEFPSFYVVTLAYQNTRTPPRHVRPRDNVLVMYCNMEASFSQAITGTQNKKFKDEIESWSMIAPHLFTWDYLANYTNFLLPQPNMNAIAPNIRFFAKNKTMGIFECANRNPKIGDFPAMRNWVMSHLLWDPNLDDQKLIDEFLEGYYGPAAKPLRKYIELIHNAVQQKKIYLGCYKGYAEWFDFEALINATSLFNEAALLVKDNPVLSQRVDSVRISLDTVWIQKYDWLTQSEKSIAKKTVPELENPQKFCENYVARIKSHDKDAWFSDNCTFDKVETSFLNRFKNSPAPYLCSDLNADEWIDMQDAKLGLYAAGSATWWVDDEKASDKRAAKILGRANSFLVECFVPQSSIPLHCYVVARCKLRPGAQGLGTAFKMQFWNPTTNKAEYFIKVPVSEIMDEKYKTYYLGVYKQGGLLTVASCGNANEIEDVYIDRMFFVKEKNE